MSGKALRKHILGRSAAYLCPATDETAEYRRAAMQQLPASLQVTGCPFTPSPQDQQISGQVLGHDGKIKIAMGPNMQTEWSMQARGQEITVGGRACCRELLIGGKDSEWSRAPKLGQPDPSLTRASHGPPCENEE